VSYFRPSAAIDLGVLCFRFFDSPAIRSIDIDCVADLTDFGDVVGIEILDLRGQLAGGMVEPPKSDGDFRWAYDEEIDALYLRVTDARGQVQRSLTAQARLDSLGRFVQLDVDLREIS
jgi:uncharacterized protein YuzE